MSTDYDVFTAFTSSAPGVVPSIKVVRRPLHIYFLIDRSLSMKGERINAINQALPATIHSVQQAMSAHPEVDAVIHILTYGDNVTWQGSKEGVPLKDFVWSNIVPGGKTAMARAILELCDQLDVANMSKRGFPPVCILTSDGFDTDGDSQYEAAIARLNRIPWGRKAVRLVVAIGEPVDYDENALLQFSNQPSVGILRAKDAASIVKYIKWVTVAASVGATRSKSNLAEGDRQGNVVIQAPPEEFIASSDIW